MKKILFISVLLLMMIYPYAFSWAFPFSSFRPIDDTIWMLSDSCHQATPFCADSIYIYASWMPPGIMPFVECYPFGPPPDSCILDLYCINSNNQVGHILSPKWFIIKANSAGWVQIVSFNTERHIDTQFNDTLYFYPRFNYHLWGPYDEPNPPCVSGLTLDKKIACEDRYLNPFTPTYDTLTFFAEADKFYYLLTFLIGILGEDTIYHRFWQGNAGQPGAAQLACEGVNSCTIYHITTHTGSCNPATNTFTLSGTVYFYNAPSTGQLIIYDNNTGYGTAFYPPFVSPLQFSIPGLPCDNTSHTLIATFWDEPGCDYSTLYPSAVLCPDAVLSGGGQACEGDSLQLQVMLSPFVQTPVTFTLACNGIVFDTISYSGSFPWHTWVKQPGTYTIDTVYNPLCAGNPAGQAFAAFHPLPQPNLGNDITTCEGRPVILDAGSGFAVYLWNTDEITQTIQVFSSGLYQVTVIDNHGCKGSDEIQVNFVPAPQPLLIKHN